MSRNDTHHSPGKDGHAHDSDTRFWLTNDILVYILNASMIWIFAVSMFGYTISVPSDLMSVYVASIALANIWAFGGKAANKLGSMMGGNR